MPDEINIPFWKQTPPEGDTAAQTSVSDTGDDPKPGDVVMVGGHEFVWTESVRAEVSLLDSGKDLGRVYIPYDPNNKPGEDDMLARATRLYHDMEHIRSIVSEDVVSQLTADIHSSGTATSMIALVAEGLAGSLSVTFDDDTPPEQREVLAAEASRLFDKKLPEIIPGLLEIEGGPIKGFWHQFARDILATATIHARDDTADTLGGPEALDDATFEAEVFNAYRNGPYITSAMLSLTPVWTETLYAIVSTTMTGISQLPYGTELVEGLLTAARKSLGMDATPATRPTFTPAFDADGYGRVANDLIARGVRQMLVAPWPGPRTRPPEFQYLSDSGAVTYGVERALDSLQDAWAIVDRLDDGHADLFDFILTKMLASMAVHSRDIYGDFIITPQEIYNARGLKKHPKGGHRPEYIREIISQMEDLKQIQLRAELSRHTKSKRGGKPSRVSIEHAVDLIDIHETIEEVSPEGERTVLAWNLRPGNWTRALEGFTEQYALMMQGILMLHSTRERNAKRIGRYLIAQYRIRAFYKNWEQGYDVRTILDGAGIPIPDRNKPRFKSRIEAALDTLASPQKMHGPVCIDSWKYIRSIDMSRGDWFECWLETPVTILPTQKLMEDQYRGISRKSGRKLRPKQLAG